MGRESITVVVVDDEPIIRMDIKGMVSNAGYTVVGEGSDGFDAIELCKKLNPTVILLDIKMELMDGLSAAKVISEECPETAIIMLTAFSKGEYIDKAKESKISSYLLKPINENLLVPNIELAVAKNLEIQKFKSDVDRAKVQLETRKLIEKAKGILMKGRRQSEEEAFNYIREISKAKQMSMSKVAKLIIEQYEQAGK